MFDSSATSFNTVEFKKYFIYHAFNKERGSYLIKFYVNKELKNRGVEDDSNIMRIELLDLERKPICKPAEFKFDYKLKERGLSGKHNPNIHMPAYIRIKMGEHYENELFHNVVKIDNLFKELLEWIESK